MYKKRKNHRNYISFSLLAGFISIDCGIPENSKYVDAVTTLTYTSDNQFIDTGTNRNISAGYVTPSLARRYLTVRSFTTGRRNCYTMNSLMAGQKYLVRAMFLYANYDGLNKPPVFDVHVGVNFCRRSISPTRGPRRLRRLLWSCRRVTCRCVW